jgi:hypothetical protein
MKILIIINMFFTLFKQIINTSIFLYQYQPVNAQIRYQPTNTIHNKNDEYYKFVLFTAK